MWSNLDPYKSSIIQVFEPLNSEILKFKHPWSIAELQLEDEDIKWLRLWFHILKPKDATSYLESVSTRQMLGLLLICAGAETCRENCNEDSVWPIMRSILPEDFEIRDIFFLSNGQPTQTTKRMIVDAVQTYNLRHAIDIEGIQQWFVTIKLQFGFTFHGTRNRLAEWLVNMGRPRAIEYLNGETEFVELASISFQSMWRALIQFRRGLIKEREVIETLHQNPWVKRHWIPNLLKEATSKIEILGAGEERKNTTLDEYASVEEFCPITDISLEWAQGKTPRLLFHLDRLSIERETYGKDIGELDIYVDSRKICRWVRQIDGHWSGDESIFSEPEANKSQPNLNPQTLVIRSRIGETLVEWDLTNSGLSEEVLVFDLECKRTIKTALEPLEVDKYYAIVCDRNYQFNGNTPLEIFEKNPLSKKAIRLSAQVDENLCITYEDFVLWQPVREKIVLNPLPTITVMTPGFQIFSLNDKSKLIVEGVPFDAEDVKLLINKKIFDVEQIDCQWMTKNEINLTPELAATYQKVWIRYSYLGKSRTQKAKLVLMLLGAAMLHHERKVNTEIITLKTLNKNSCINIAERTCYLRIWAPDKNNIASLFENNCRIGRLRHNKISLRDIPGHGGQLNIICGNEKYSLGITCYDTGDVCDFTPPILGTEAVLRFLIKKDPAELGESGYRLYEWAEERNQKATICNLTTSVIKLKSTEREWRFRSSPKPLSIFLTWKGSWLGAWWDLEQIYIYFSMKKEITEQECSLLKWLRVPILHPQIFRIIKKVIYKSPCRFIKAWLADIGLPVIFISAQNILAIDYVLRYFFWNNFPPVYAKDGVEAISQIIKGMTPHDKWIEVLSRLSDISPVLFTKGIEQCAKFEPGSVYKILKNFIQKNTGIQNESDNNRRQYRLRELEQKTVTITGLCEEGLKNLIKKRFDAMDHQLQLIEEQEQNDLLKLSESLQGRRYLSTSITMLWIEKNIKGKKG